MLIEGKHMTAGNIATRIFHQKMDGIALLEHAPLTNDQF
jgi:hypothetical protein